MSVPDAMVGGWDAGHLTERAGSADGRASGVAGGGASARDEEFDGIRQEDAPAPAWWHMSLAVLIVFGAFYFLVSMVSPVYVTPVERLGADQAREYARLFEGVGTLEPTPGALLTLMDNQKWETIASGMFRSNCASCHGGAGAGQVGPNLTDDHYKNVASVGDIYTVIAEGAGNGAMPGWAGRFSQNEMVLLSAYVASLRGTSPGGTGRGPEGSRIDPWPHVEAAQGASASGSSGL
jgi:cytochrome c oxidase cbb3-type subunit 3